MAVKITGHVRRAKAGKTTTRRPLCSKGVDDLALSTLSERTDIDKVQNLQNAFGVWVPEGLVRVNLATFSALFDERLVRFCVKNPARPVTSKLALQLGLIDLEEDDVELGEVADVRRVAMSHGHPGLHVPPGHVRGGTRGVIYGSLQGKGGTMDLRSEEWFEIHLPTLRIRTRPPASAGGFGEEADDDEDRGPQAYKIVDDGSVEIVSDEDPQDSVTETYFWLKENLGHVLMVDGAGARGDSEESKKHEVHGVRVPFQSKKNECMAFSVLNAATLVRGFGCGEQTLGTITDKALFRLRTKATMAGLAKWVQVHMPDLVLQHLKDDKGFNRRSHWFDVPRVLEQFPSGMFLVRLIGKDLKDGGRIDHLVVVDTDQQLIWDSFERNPMRLSKASLSCCVGDGVALMDVQEVRQLVQLYPIKVDGTRRFKKRGRASRKSKRKHHLPVLASIGK